MINVDDGLLSANEAAERLGVKLDTLYAYVSRGRLVSVTVPGTRQKRYPAAAVAALLVGRAPDSSLPAPALARPPDLAAAANLEEAARLLWQSPAELPDCMPAEAADKPPAAGFLARAQIGLAAAAVTNAQAHDFSASGLARSGRLILRALTVCAAGPKAAEGPAHLGLAAGWSLAAPGAELLRDCLIASIEPEPDAATAVARLVASAGASPYAVVGAALATVSGGGGPSAAAGLFAELVGSPVPAVAVMAARLARGRTLPGFGRSQGEPRAAAILAALVALLPAEAGPVTAAADAGIRLTGARPDLDFALAATAAALHLPAEAALAIYAAGRAVGWIAHAAEAYRSAAARDQSQPVSASRPSR